MSYSVPAASGPEDKQQGTIKHRPEVANISHTVTYPLITYIIDINISRETFNLIFLHVGAQGRQGTSVDNKDTSSAVF